MAAQHARFGVVVCPRCRHAKGASLEAESTTCARCGSRHKVRGLRVFYETDDAVELQEAVGLVEAKVKGGDAGLIDVAELRQELEARTTRASPRVSTPRRSEDDLIGFAASRAAAEQGPSKKVDAIFAALDEHGPEEGFTEAQLMAAFTAANLPPERAEKELRKAFVQQDIYEPRPGRWKRLD